MELHRIFPTELYSNWQPVLTRLAADVPGICSQQTSFWIAGGYAAARFIVNQNDPYNYYNDLDLYAHSEHGEQMISGYLNGFPNSINTDLAITAQGRHFRNGKEYQLVRGVWDNCRAIFETYDFDIVCFAIEPSFYPETEDLMWTTKAALLSLVSKTLTVANKDIILRNLGSEAHRVKELYRTRKYCDRYGMTLSDELFGILIDSYREQDIENFRINTTGAIINSTGAPTYNQDLHRFQNAWNLVGNLLQQHPLYTPAMDTHGILTNPVLREQNRTTQFIF